MAPDGAELQEQVADEMQVHGSNLRHRSSWSYRRRFRTSLRRRTRLWHCSRRRYRCRLWTSLRRGTSWYSLRTRLGSRTRLCFWASLRRSRTGRRFLPGLRRRASGIRRYRFRTNLRLRRRPGFGPVFLSARSLRRRALISGSTSFGSGRRHLTHSGNWRARGRGLVWGRQRARRYQRRWFCVTASSDKLGAIAGCFAHVLNLSAHRRRPRAAHHGQLLGRRPRVDTTAATVVANAIAPVVRNIVVVNIVNNRDIHIGYRPVVVNTAVIPICAIIAAARVSIAVIDATVVPDMLTPVA